MKINPILAIDSYKLAHISMYPEQIKETYLNLTPRVMKYFQRLVPDEFKYDNKIVAFGVQMAVTDLVTQFAEEFFSKPLEQVLEIYIDTITPFIGDGIGVKDLIISEISKLHAVGYLPITIKALPEGSLIPVQTPVLTIRSTQFAWLGGYLETYISQNTWKTITIATVSRLYRKIRDTSTGAIIDTQVYTTKEQIEGKRLLIVDDICAGGRTFKELAQKLKSIANCDIDLYVTHGFFNNSVDVIDSLVESGISDIHIFHNPYKLKHSRLNNV